MSGEDAADVAVAIADTTLSLGWFFVVMGAAAVLIGWTLAVCMLVAVTTIFPRPRVIVVPV